MKKLIFAIGPLLFGLLPLAAQDFSYLPLVANGPRHLSLYVELGDGSTGKVRVNGVDTRSPPVPFSWNWGDGSVETGWFPQEHTFTDKDRNYILKVTSSGETAEALILFKEPGYSPGSLPASTAVSIAERDRRLPARWYDALDIVPFTQGDFGVISRKCIEYVSSAMADIQHDYTNDNLWYFEEKEFTQIIFRTDFAGGFSCWFTEPPSLAVSSAAFRGNVGWNTLAHEMGHNFTLNFPGTYHIGGRIDGNANAIYSESLAQIFSLSCGYDLINQKDAYGISDDLAVSLRLEFENGFILVLNNYQKYLDEGRHFCCWNDPLTTEDETFTTFMTIACEFMVRAEQTSYPLSYHVSRLMDFFSHFNQEWEIDYDRENPSVTGRVFRSTMMVAALSFALRENLMEPFMNLGFPLDDDIFSHLMNEVSARVPGQAYNNGLQIIPNPTSGKIYIKIPENQRLDQAVIFNMAGRPVIRLDKPPGGEIDLGPLSPGIYCISVLTDKGRFSRKVVRL